MSFVLDTSVTMRWFFGDGKPRKIAYAGKVLDAMKKDEAHVPVTWGLEVANIIAIATLDEDLQKAAKKSGVRLLA